MKGIPVAYVAKIVDGVFRNNYWFGRYNAFHDEHEGEDLHTVLYELTGADHDDVISAIADQLMADDPYWPPDGDQPFYSNEASYERSYDAFNGHSYLWNEFCESIVFGQRFFNSEAKALLSKIFDGIHLQKGLQRSNPVYAIEPGSELASLHRVRNVGDLEVRRKIREDVPAHMGPPPTRLRRPGRMNPSGIVALYAGFDLETCIAEMRPTVGDVIVSAQFELTEPLWVLDTTSFSGGFKEPNLFSKDHMRRTAQWRFMQRFMVEIARPISRDDEHLDYIPTQAVAEYLLNHHEFHIGGAKHRIEAIIYRSAQHPEGKNIVILGDACAIEAKQPSSKTKSTSFDDTFDNPLSYLPGSRSPGALPRMRFKKGSIEEYKVQGASFKSVPHEEFRYEDDHENATF
ncbi:RES family NAD+ phosphorylase [Rhizobium tumorigenes]|uniref:RES family NAD+ phosphorylase n=1 Tax=Rhizobium tumorigenes TaxID=2041385 RepID=UPI0024204A2A|nr:RES family NAD+ phosphorylase [Rhizobium tumorigenes]WFS02384.1 RES family NAD+ phosphorylase [Rhizobium tumorigenes]